MERCRKLLSAMLVLCLILELLPCSVLAGEPQPGLENFTDRNTYAAGQFTDVAERDWYYENVKSVYELDLMLGKSNQRFDPDGNITIAEAVTIAVRLHAAYEGRTFKPDNAEPWYRPYVEYAVANGIIQDVYSDYNRAATRLQCTTILSNALPKSVFEQKNQIADNSIPDVKVSDPGADGIYLFYRAGILAGNDKKGTFAPGSSIRRSETAAIITRMVKPELRVNVTLDSAGGTAGTVTSSSENIFMRARSYGFVPEELWENPDKIITMSEFCRLLENIISMWNEDKLDAWREIAKLAMDSDDRVQMDEALVAIFEAAIALNAQMRQGYGGGGLVPDWAPLAEAMNEGIDWWNGYKNKHRFRNEYPYFPDFASYVDPVTGQNAAVSAIGFEEQHCSLVDYSFIFPPEDDWTLDFGRDITRKEAIRAATVFAECDATFYDGAAEYVAPENAGTYDTSIITPKLLSKETDLPTPTRRSLPKTWRGMGLSHRKDAQHPYNNFKESDIRVLAENGFNFVRLFLNMNTLQFPYKNTADNEVNILELKKLDQLLAWCMEYDVHLQITCVGIQGFDSQGIQNMGQMADRNWQVFVEHWKMLGKRYADISPAYLSFELLNEWKPKGDKKYIDHIAQYFFDAADAIWAANPDRVVFGCTGAVFEDDYYTWLEKLASHGIVLGAHPYYPIQICGRLRTTVYLDEPSWPIPWFPSGVKSGDEITIEGELGGGILTIYFEKADWPTHVYVYGNGKLLEELDPSHIISELQSDRNSEPFVKGYDIKLPEGITDVSLKTGEQTVWYRGLKFNKNGSEHGVTASDYSYNNLTGEARFKVDESGWHSANGRMYTTEDIFETKIKPIIDIGKRYNVGVMVNEMGCCGGADLGAAECEYVNDMIATLEKHGVSWSYCEMWIAGIVEVANTDDFIVYDYEDGRTEKFWYKSSLMDVFRKYTMAK